ncbi:MAG: type IV secretion system protein [Alphaproteobacteria bacterium]|nr:type IV secretion system protein [Alphaproteobacteria bacterium]
MSIFNFLFKELDDSTNDRLGAYPEKVHVNAMPERRYLKTSRIMTLISTGLICGVIIWTLMIFILNPLIRTTPKLFSVDDRLSKLDIVEETVKINDGTKYFDSIWINSTTSLIEQYIRHYVLLRHTVLPDVDVMFERWGRDGENGDDACLLRWFSSKNVYTEFQKDRKYLLERMQEGLTVETRIRNIRQVSSNFWIVDFDTIEHTPESVDPIMKRFRVTLTTGFSKVPRDDYKSHMDMISNPLNFIVGEYDVCLRSLTD